MLKKTLSKFPRWLKIFLILIGLMFVGPMLVPFGELILPVTLFLIVLFPGKNSQNPRIIKVIPFLWILSFFSALVLAFFKYFSSVNLPQEVLKITDVEIAYTIVTTPLLFWLFFIQKKDLLKKAVIVVFVGYLGVIGYGFNESKSILELVGNTLSEIILTYALLSWLKNH